MTAPTRRAALTALAGVPALAIPAAAMGAQKPNPSSAEPATIEQMAEMNFRPWEHTEDEWKPPSNTEWNSHGTHSSALHAPGVALHVQNQSRA